MSCCSISERVPVEEILGTEPTAHVTVAVHRATVETTWTLANGGLLDVVHEEIQLRDVGSHGYGRAIGDLAESAHVVVVGILAPFGLLVDRPVRFEVYAILDQRTAIVSDLIREQKRDVLRPRRSILLFPRRISVWVWSLWRYEWSC